MSYVIHLNSFFAVRGRQRGVFKDVAESELYKNKLRKEYEDSVEARAFLKKHPEFAGFELESSHNVTSNHAFYNNERENSPEKERSLLIQEKLPEFPDKFIVKLLTAYFEGARLSQLCKMTKLKKGATKVAIHRAKGRVHKWALTQPNKTTNAKSPIETKTLVYCGTEKQVFLIVVANNETYWVTKDSEILPEDIQEILDSTDEQLIDLGEG